jgi:type III secretion protein V
MRRHACELLGIEETQRLLSRLEEQAPALVRHVVPRPVTVPRLAQVLQRLLAEGVSIRPLREILEALADRPDAEASVDVLVERVRGRLRRQITARHAPGGRIRVHAVDPVIEEVVREAITRDGQESFLALPPDEARDILGAVQRLCQAEPHAVLVTQPDVRHFLRQLLSAEHPEVAVLSYPELGAEIVVERGAPVSVGGSSER